MACEVFDFGVVGGVKEIYCYCDLSLKFLSLGDDGGALWAVLVGSISAKRFSTSLMSSTMYIPPRDVNVSVQRGRKQICISSK